MAGARMRRTDAVWREELAEFVDNLVRKWRGKRQSPLVHDLTAWGDAPFPENRETGLWAGYAEAATRGPVSDAGA